MGYVIWVVCLILALIKPKSKKVTVLILAYIWILYALNYYTPDGLNYERVYRLDRILYSFFYEPAYTVLMIVAKKLGMAFGGFRMMLGTLYTAGIYVVVRRYTKYVNYALVLFAIFPLIYFISVIRSGLAGLLVVYAVSCLFSDKPKAELRYVAWIAVATLFHMSSVVFLPLLLAKYRIRTKWLALTLGCCIFAIALAALTEIPYRIVQLFTDSERIVGWFRIVNDGEPNVKGFLLMSCVAIGGAVLSLLLSASLRTIPRDLCSESFVKTQRMADTVVRINMILLCLLPFLAVSSVYMRFFYQLFPINICLCAAVSGELMRLRQNKRLPFVTVAAWVGLAWTVLLMLYVDYPNMNTDGSMLLSYDFKYNWVRFLYYKCDWLRFLL